MEENFPRGGLVKKEKKAEKSREKELFKEPTEGNVKTKKLKKSVATKTFAERKELLKTESKTKKKIHKAEKSVPEKKDGPVILSKKMLQPGLLVLCSIKNISDYKLEVNLPNALSGVIPITNISQAYTESLRRFAEQQGSSETIYTLKDLFRVGMILPCKVQEVKPSVKLTIDPKEVNSSLRPENLCNGLPLMGSVASCEDHGYVIDIGVAGATAFLTTKHAEIFIKQNNNGHTLKMGQCVQCCVQKPKKSIDVRSVAVTIDPNTIREMTKEMHTGFNTLIPGMKVSTRITKVAQNGLSTEFPPFHATVHMNHLPSPPTDYEEKKKLKACILFRDNETKRIGLTCHPVKLGITASNPAELQGVSQGSLIEEAVVTKIEEKRGVYFTIKDSVHAFANYGHMNIQKGSKLEKSKELFPVGSKHRCRVLRVHPLEQLAIVSLKKSDLESQNLVIDDIKPGDVIKCILKQFVKMGVRVKISKSLMGFVPDLHLSDITVSEPQKRFTVGEKWNCRVLSVNLAKGIVTLTNKKSLVRSKLPIITAYGQCEAGQDLNGFISNIKNNGVHVSFYNRIEGFVPGTYLSSVRIEYPEKVFFLGQVVKCRVLNVEPKKKKLKLSFVLAGKLEFGMKRGSVDFDIGKIVSCTVTRKVKEGLDVILNPGAVKGFLPIAHLSDFVSLCKPRYQAYKKGDVIDEVICYHKASCIVSRKQSFIRAAKAGGLVTAFSDLQVNMMVPGLVQKHVDYGMFVEMPGGLFSLVPTKFVADKRVTDRTLIYQKGQSVEVKVMEVQEDKHRFLSSLRMIDCYHGDTTNGLDLAKMYLKERQVVLDAFSDMQGQRLKGELTKFKVGCVYQTTVTTISKHGAICDMGKGVKAVATQDHIKDTELEEGKSVKCRLLYVDLTSDCLEISLIPSFVNSAPKEGRRPVKVSVGQKISAEVLHVTPEAVLAETKSHNKGQLLYLPGKRHLNDVLEHHQYGVGQVNKVVIKSIDDGLVMASLKIHEAGESEDTPAVAVVPHIPTHSLEVGQVYDASINKVLHNSMLVKLGDVVGRLHVTEMLDTIKNGRNPLESFKQNQKLRVKVVGFRDVKKWNYLPISHPNRVRAMPDCSIRPSILDKAEFPDSYKYGTNYFRTGDKVVAYMTHFHSNYLWTKISPMMCGIIHGVHLSHDLDIKPRKEFKPGHGYNATVIGQKDDTTMILSLTGEKCSASVGCKTKGVITAINSKSGLVLSLVDQISGVVDLTDITDEYTNSPVQRYNLGQVVLCYVLSKETESRVRCSLRLSRLTQLQGPDDCPDVQSIDDVSCGQIIKGYVAKHADTSIFIRIGHELSGQAQNKNITNDSTVNIRIGLPIGHVVTAKVLSIDEERKSVEFSLLEKDTSVSLQLQKPKESSSRKRAISISDLEDNGTEVRRKKKDKKEVSKQIKRKQDSSSEVASKKSKVEVSSDDSGVEVSGDCKTDRKRLEVTDTFSWDTEFKMPSALPSQGQGQGDISSDDSDDEEDNRPVRKTKEEVRQGKQEEEKRLYELERKRMMGGVLPETADDFDRLVLQSPNSSMVWLSYMAFHLETTQIDKARAVAERALKTIAFREEQEKLNVWFAYLNLENMYGTAETVNNLLVRAGQQADQIKVYQQMIQIYAQSGKIAEAEQIHNTLAKKHGHLLEIWVKFGQFYFQSDRHESARRLLQRSLKALDKVKHVEAIAKFAQMEFKFGDPERGKTMFENVLSSYPKRTDLWSVYIDMLTKLKEVDNTRQLFERVIGMKLSAKKMKFFFKKYLEFEHTHGDQVKLAAIKQKALDYVESRGFVDE